MLPSADRLYKSLSADFFTLGVNKTPLTGRQGVYCTPLTLNLLQELLIPGYSPRCFFGRGSEGVSEKQKTAFGNIVESGLEVQSRW